MQRSDEQHLLPIEVLPLARAFLRGFSIQTPQGEVISGHGVSYGKTYIEAFPEYIHNDKEHKSKIDGIMNILQELSLKPLPGSEVAVRVHTTSSWHAIMASKYLALILAKKHLISPGKKLRMPI